MSEIALGLGFTQWAFAQQAYSSHYLAWNDDRAHPLKPDLAAKQLEALRDLTLTYLAVLGYVCLLWLLSVVIRGMRRPRTHFERRPPVHALPDEIEVSAHPW